MFIDKNHEPKPIHLRFTKRGSVSLKCLVENDFLDKGVCTRNCLKCEYGKNL